MVKFSRGTPVTGLPCLSVTTTGTSTSSLCDRIVMRGGFVSDGFCATAEVRRQNKSTSFRIRFMTLDPASGSKRKQHNPKSQVFNETGEKGLVRLHRRP